MKFFIILTQWLLDELIHEERIVLARTRGDGDAVRELDDTEEDIK